MALPVDYDCDELSSSDLEELLRVSTMPGKDPPTTKKVSKKPVQQANGKPLPQPQIQDKSLLSDQQQFQKRKSELDEEIRDLDFDIKRLSEYRQNLVSERDVVENKLQILSGKAARETRVAEVATENNGLVNYMKDEFPWSKALKERMREVFGINDFRLCQLGVCNANMDRRDVVCVMPTGGGKSLTYQLPALFSPGGLTLVISPLISLITDQILHLREFGVEAVMLTGATSKEENRDVSIRLTQAARGNGASSGKPEIKLCYVTPEKIAKSKYFMSTLERLAEANKLERIVIDEAHCVSQLGHDFRPDYRKLSILRQLFPRVPILALSATCPPKVLNDLIKTLRLNKVVSGEAYKDNCTAYFSAPLYRKNLHYKVLPKSAAAKAAIQEMADYILTNHKNETGIVYCLSKKDSETVAEGLREASSNVIKTGVYHADIRDEEKENLHRRWRKGEIKVVCATIAFGLGIDKGDVRFVLHHSMSKSLDGYYQESGRAGRDGGDSDCILYYRPQDVTRLSSMVMTEVTGLEKLREMVKFAQSIDDCRKLQFARYFSASSSLSMSAWETKEVGANERCGHCDNCIRPPETKEERDVTVETWQIIRVTEYIYNGGGRVTLAKLADLVRGAGGGSFDISNGKAKGKGKARLDDKGKVSLDLDDVANGKVKLNKDDTEKLLLHLTLEDYLKESYHQTAYSTNIYLEPGDKSLRFSRLNRTDIDNFQQRIKLSFTVIPRKTQKRKRPSGVRADEIGDEIEDFPMQDAIELYVDDEEIPPSPKRRASIRRNSTAAKTQEELSDSRDFDDDNWQKTMRNGHRTEQPERILRTQGSKQSSSSRNTIVDVIELSDSD